ncbi:YkuS family protein [Alkaliphilus pronyensis]|uniref:YkuS family protein n=1 Tax=Alkaliphilus pronyensis TaxID=1482732 RepID=A0A6I0EX39_9FIRM|nr:YkuS family protein [Alkaliphilus pronyensis]KAB3532875.1 YkuS family protein [Alkaliphilus pronyensis]
MKNRIAVEDSLTDVRDYLQQKGYQVESLSRSKELEGFDAIVVTGQDSNILGMENANTKSPVITARGQSAQLIYDEIQKRLR